MLILGLLLQAYLIAFTLEDTNAIAEDTRNASRAALASPCQEKVFVIRAVNAYIPIPTPTPIATCTSTLTAAAPVLSVSTVNATAGL